MIHTAVELETIKTNKARTLYFELERHAPSRSTKLMSNDILALMLREGKISIDIYF